ncbi:MAG: SDH family Clp fold serine proteinase [Thermomicrobiales bacterium]
MPKSVLTSSEFQEQLPSDEVAPNGASDAPAQDSDETPDEEVQSKYFAGIFPGKEEPIDRELGQILITLEKQLGMPLWLLMLKDGRNGEFDPMEGWLEESFRTCRHDFPANETVALLIHSGGGQGDVAYQIASLLQRHCNGFIAIIPQYAKSAATLLALGANEIWLADSAQLGPVDVQIRDDEREEDLSALDEVQSLERLHAFSLEAVDRTLLALKGRTKKKDSTLLPMALDFTANLMRPLFEKIDAVHYTQMDRALQEAEDYAVRLLMVVNGSIRKSERIAHTLLARYPTHRFIINPHEAKGIGLPVKYPLSDEIEGVLEALAPYLGVTTAVGKVQEVTG